MKNKTATLTFGKMVMYSIGIFGIQMFIGYINSYQSQFYTSILNAQLTKCAVIILVAKIISSFADPVIGNLIDASHFKSGKMRPFVAMSILPLALLTTLMFTAISFKTDAGMYTYITITTVLWNIAMSFADIPSQGMLAVLSPSSEEKTACAGYANMLKSLSLVMASGIIPIVCMLTKSSVITKKEYLITAIVIDVAGIILVAMMLKSSKEVVKSEPQAMSIKAMFSELKNNKMLRIIFLMNMLGFGRNIGVSIGIQTAAVLFDEVTIPIGGGITLAGENLSILLGVGCMITSTVSVVLVPLITKKFGTKRTYLTIGAYGAVVSILMYMLFAFGGDFFRGFWGIAIAQFAIGLMFGPHGYSPMVMISDTVDYQEMVTGKRTEGIQYAVLSLSIKLSNAFSVASGIFIVGLSGYTGTMAFSDITVKMQNIVMGAYWLLPGICVALSCIPVLFYTLDKPEIKAAVKKYMTEKMARQENTSAEKAK